MTKKTKDDELVFLPLGGSNEIGMNFQPLRALEPPPRPPEWIVVDLGITFSSDLDGRLASR